MSTDKSESPLEGPQSQGHAEASAAVSLTAEPFLMPAVTGQASAQVITAGDRLMVRIFFVFFAILGFFLLCDMLRGILRW